MPNHSLSMNSTLPILARHTRAVRAMWTNRKGRLVWRRCYQAVDTEGNPIGSPQGTARFARSYAVQGRLTTVA